MSSSDSFPALSGGIPTKSQDLAASIIFTIAFALLLIPAAWRLISSESRSLVLIRPTIFCIAQVVAYGIRAVIANGNDSTQLFEASEILLLAGFILICEPIPALLTRVIGKKPKKGQLPTVPLDPRLAVHQRVLALLRVALIVALVMGIVAATSISTNESASTEQNIKTYRIVNAALVIVALVGCALVSISIISHGLLEHTAIIFLLVQSVLIIITAAYKLENVLKPAGSFSIGGKIAFYVLNSAVQWFIGANYFVLNLNRYFIDPSKRTQNGYPMTVQV